MPITGVMPMHMPMLMKVWKAIAVPTPTQSSMSKVLPEWMPTLKQWTIMIISSAITIRQPIMPQCSPMLAKIKSVCLPVKAVAVCPSSTPVSRPEARVSWLCLVCQVMP